MSASVPVDFGDVIYPIRMETIQLAQKYIAEGKNHQQRRKLVVQLGTQVNGMHEWGNAVIDLLIEELAKTATEASVLNKAGLFK